MKTIFLVRHADIDRPPGPAPLDWPLNEAGRARARTLAHALGAVGLAAIYVSQASRTKETAVPIAEQAGLLPREAPTDAADLAAEILADGGPATALVVGHSNTVPEFIAALGGPSAGPPLGGHDDLFVLTVAGSGERRLIRLKYGPRPVGPG